MTKPYVSRTVNAGEHALPSLAQAIASALKRLQVERGGKNLAGSFDGREGKEVAESTVSRWIGEPARFPAVFLPVLVELDEAFRVHVFQILAQRMTSPASVVREMSPKAAEEYRRVLDERFRRAAFGPGGAGEHYS